MQFRTRTLIAAISMMLLIYMLLGGMIVRYIMRKFVFIGSPVSSGPPPRLLAAPDPFWCFVLSIMPLWWIIEMTFTLVRRHNRARPGFCRGCGRQLRHDLSRCQHCGTRIYLTREFE